MLISCLFQDFDSGGGYEKNFRLGCKKTSALVSFFINCVMNTLLVQITKNVAFPVENYSKEETIQGRKLFIFCFFICQHSLVSSLLVHVIQLKPIGFCL